MWCFGEGVGWWSWFGGIGMFLFWGLIVPRTRLLTGVVRIQLEPDEMERRYLQRYLDEYEFRVHWGSVQDYVTDLFERVQS